MNDFDIPDYLFVIDTDSYAGNFEREMCAFMTGRIGECEVGQRTANEFVDEFGEKFEDKIYDAPDDHGCCRPATCYPTPGFSNLGGGKIVPVQNEEDIKYPAYHSVAISFSERLDNDELKFLVVRAEEYAKSNKIQ